MSDTWLIFFEDADRNSEIFIGKGAEDAARKRFHQCLMNWSCHLFKNVTDGNLYSYVHMRKVVKGDRDWCEKTGLYWNWKLGYKNLREAFEIIESKKGETND